MKKIAVLCTFLIILTAFTGCIGAKSDIKKLVKRYEVACNSYDLNGVLDCIHPDTAEKIDYVAGLAGKLTSKSPEEVLDKIASVILGISNAADTHFFSTLKITLEDIEVTDNTATANGKVTYGEEETKEKSAEISFEKVGESWYIKDFDMK